MCGERESNGVAHIFTLLTLNLAFHPYEFLLSLRASACVCVGFIHSTACVCNRNMPLCFPSLETFKAIFSRTRITLSQTTNQPAKVNPGDYYCFFVACNFHITNCATRVAAGHEPDFSNSFDTWIKRLEWHCLLWLEGRQKNFAFFNCLYSS